MYKVILIWDKFFLKCEGGRGQIDPPQKKATLKMLCLISFEISEATWDEEYELSDVIIQSRAIFKINSE